jgi:hypothetical protein
MQKDDGTEGERKREWYFLDRKNDRYHHMIVVYVQFGCFCFVISLRNEEARSR